MSAVVETLVNAGIDARAYARGPAGVRAFVASIDPHPKAGRLWIWEGKSEIEVATNKRQRQGVLNVAEEGRTVTLTLHTEAYQRSEAGRAVDFRPEEEIRDQAIEQMRQRWSLPLHTHYEARIRFMPKSLRSGSAAQVVVTAIAPASNTSLLVGMDETHHFVAQLPRVGVKSVAHAHRLLKPREAREPGTKRQGEWFFVPERNEIVQQRLMKDLPGMEHNVPLEKGSSHVAEHLLRWRARFYVLGTVSDTRRGRHAPLLLTEFHRVVRNREIVFTPTQTPQQRRYWD